MWSSTAHSFIIARRSSASQQTIVLSHKRCSRLRFAAFYSNESCIFPLPPAERTPQENSRIRVCRLPSRFPSVPFVNACTTRTSKNFNLCSNNLQQWCRFSTAAQDSAGSGENPQSLSDKVEALCDRDVFPVGAFRSSEALLTEALEILRLLIDTGSDPGIRAACRLLGRLVDEGGDGLISVDLLNSFLKGHMNYMNSVPNHRPDSTWTSKTLLQRLGTLARTPNKTTFATVLNATAQKRRHNIVTEKVENDIVQTRSNLKKIFCEENTTLMQQLNECTENALIQANASRGFLGNAMQMAKRLIEENEVSQGDSRIKIHDETFMSILIGAVKDQSSDKDQVKSFLRWAGEQYENGLVEARVETIRLFAWVLFHNSAGFNDQEWLLSSLDWIGRNVNDIHLDMEAYERAIALWTGAGGTSQAKALLDNMFYQVKNGDTRAAPNLSCCNMVLSSLSTSNDPSAGNQASAILTQMTEMLGPARLTPTYASYFTAVKCWKNSRHPEKPNEILKIIFEMQKSAANEKWSQRLPDSYLLQLVLTSLGEYPPQLEKYLEWRENEARGGNYEAKLRLTDFTILLSSLASTSAASGEEIMSILDRMRRLYDEGILTRPVNAETYSQAVRAMQQSRDPDAVTFIEQFISEYEQRTPPEKRTNLYLGMYESLMEVYLRGGEAEKIETSMRSMYNAFLGGCKAAEPQVKHFNFVLAAWGRSAAPRGAERADAIVDHMRKLHGVKLTNSEPNRGSYYYLFLCWQKSRLPGAEARLDQIKTEMQEKGFIF